MASKRRVRRTGTFATAGNTPSGGIPAPNVARIIADLGAQLEGFAKEVAELKSLVSDLRAAKARRPAWETTEDVDVGDFRRVQRRRRALMAVAFLVPVIAIVLIGVWTAGPRDPSPRTSTAPHLTEKAPASVGAPPPGPRAAAEAPPLVAPPEVSLPVAEAPAPRSPVGAGPLAAPRPAAAPAVPATTARSPAAAPSPPPVEVAPPPRPSFEPLDPPAPRTLRTAGALVHETSGGAPILD